MTAPEEVTVIEIWEEPTEIAVLEFDSVDLLKDAEVVSVQNDTPTQFRIRSYTHQQLLPQSVWQVAHRLGRYPVSWSLFADGWGQNAVEGYLVQHVDTSNLLVTMDTPASGSFRCI